MKPGKRFLTHLTKQTTEGDGKMNMKNKRIMAISTLLFLMSVVFFMAHKNVNAEAPIEGQIYRVCL